MYALVGLRSGEGRRHFIPAVGFAMILEKCSEHSEPSGDDDAGNSYILCETLLRQGFSSLASSPSRLCSGQRKLTLTVFNRYLLPD